VEELSRIKTRIESLEDLGELVNALRTMAASRAREAQEAFAGTRAYCAIIEKAIAETELLAPDTAWAPEGGDDVLLVVTSENGFVGGFNNHLIDQAMNDLRENEKLVIVGLRGQITATERGLTDFLSFGMTSRAAGVTTLARRIAAEISKVSKARLVFARHGTLSDSDIETRTVLPIEALPAAKPDLPPLTHLPPSELLNSLSEEYLFAELAHALMESLASENAARLRTMQAASRNIDDKLETLQRDERVAQQEKTTTEMLEVVVGAEAVNHH
jgi:F-type H+-transporting ATPase subunit gamma